MDEKLQEMLTEIDKDEDREVKK